MLAGADTVDPVHRHDRLCARLTVSRLSRSSGCMKNVRGAMACMIALARKRHHLRVNPGHRNGASSHLATTISPMRSSFSTGIRTVCTCTVHGSTVSISDCHVASFADM